MVPSWLIVARSYLGVTEVPGKGDSPVIQRWLRGLKAWWSDDATPWCGVFAATCLREAGYQPPQHWYRARAYLDWGSALPSPRLGCIVIYERKGGGHVGFIEGRDASGRLMTLGGNQGDRVCILPFDPARVLGFRWPPGVAQPPVGAALLPVIESTGASSAKES